MGLQEEDFLRRMRLVEGLKADLVSDVGRLLRILADGDAAAIPAALAEIVIGCHILGRRLGVRFSDLDAAVNARVEQHIRREPDAERWFGDYSEYRRHIRGEE